MRQELDEFLKRNKMTGNELAAKLGVHWTTISRWRNGREPIPNTVELALKWIDGERLYKVLKSALETVKTVLESDDPAIADTVWVPGSSIPETLLDHVCAALDCAVIRQLTTENLLWNGDRW